MKKYCCYCVPLKKNTILYSIIEFLSPNKKEDIVDSIIQEYYEDEIKYTKNPLNTNDNNRNDSNETLDLRSSVDSTSDTVNLYRYTWKSTF
jgi:hypothetical protein